MTRWCCSCGAGGTATGWKDGEEAVFAHLSAKEDGTHRWVIEPSESDAQSGSRSRSGAHQFGEQSDERGAE